MTTEPIAPSHPAKYSAPIMDKLERVLAEVTAFQTHRPIRVLDPMAGVGGVHQLADPGLIETWGLEIEPEWADQHPSTWEGDATEMPFPDSYFDVIVTSPPYGNRMADQFISKDGSRRITYYHFLGRRLHENSAAGMHFGDEYCKTMRDIFIECKRVLTIRGSIILNVSDFIRNGKVVPVVDFYLELMHDLGYGVTRDLQVPTQRMKFGANGKLRVDHERVIAFARRRY